MIALNAMVKAGLLLRDESAVPYRFGLVSELVAGADDRMGAEDGPSG